MSSVAIEHTAQRYLFSHYGHLILADTPAFDEVEKAYISNLRSDYPIMIQDDKSPQKRLHILKVDHLGTLCFDKDFRVMKEKTTPRDEVVNNLMLFFRLWKRRTEEIIVSASADNLVRISRFRHYFDPIDSILVSLFDYDEVSNVEIEHARISKRLRKLRLYLELLEGLQIIRKSENGYIAGNTFVALREEGLSEEDFRNAILSYIIRERYQTLRDVFKLTILEPTIHVDSCIYLPEVEVETAVYRTIESIGREYREYYNKQMNLLDLRLILRRLENAEAIKREGKHYFGNGQLLEKMVDMKRQLSSISMGLLTKP